MTTAPPARRTAVVFGETGLTAAVVRRLLDRGWDVTALVTPDTDQGAWAADRGIPVLAPAELAPGRVPARFDLLLLVAAASFHRLDPAPHWLAARARWAVNHHDSLLPSYPGYHVTSWAVRNRERTHGATWHVLTAELDAGPVLAQEPVPVAPGDTTAEVNAKAFDAALRALDRLLAGAEGDALAPRPQPPGPRRVYGRGERPADGGLLRWDRPAAELAAAVRSLDYGRADNPLALAKLWTPAGWWAVGSAEVVADAPDFPPGTVVTVDAGQVTVRVADGGLRCRGLRTAAGARVRDIGAELRLAPGDRLPDPGPAAWRAVARWSERFGDDEVETLDRWKSAVPLRWTDATAAGDWVAGDEIAVPAPGPNEPAPEHAAALIEAFARLAAPADRLAVGDIGWVLPPADPDLPTGLRVPVTPVRVDPSAPSELRQWLTRAGTLDLPADLLVRHAAIETALGRGADGPLPVLVSVTREGTAVALSAIEGGQVALVVAVDGHGRPTAVRTALRASLTADADLVAGLARFAAFATGRPAPPPAGAHAAAAPALSDRLAAAMRLAPDRPAVVGANETWTFAELERRTHAAARSLRERGIGPGDRVAILAERAPETVAALLGALFAGAAFVPLAPSDPWPRLVDLCRRAQVRAVATARGARADALAPVVFRLDELCRERPDAGPFEPVPRRPDQPVYLMHTSGTTSAGAPKPVSVPEAALLNHMDWMLAEFGFTRADVFVQKSPLHFDASVWEWLAPLMLGAKLVLAAPHAHRDPAELAAVVRRHAVTVLQLTPSQGRAIVSSGRTDQFKGVKQLFFGGEALPTALVRDFRAAGVERVVNLYGPTEVTIDSTWHDCRPDDAGATAPIGRPVRGIGASVRGPDGAALTGACEGELWLSGAGLALGYFNQPDRTRERFPVEPGPGGEPVRWYRTGDRVARRADGVLEFLGRRDRESKIGGRRVHLEEVEAALAELPGVRAAAATVIGDPPHLVGYVAPDSPGAALVPLDLRRALRERVPESLVPAAVVVVPALPLGPTGKVDYARLPAPPDGRPAADRPRPGAEEVVAAVWAEVLGLEPARVGRDDSWFDLGGTSLLLLAMQQAVEARTGRALTLLDVLRHPTLSQLAALLTDRPAERAPRPAVPAVEPVAVVGLACRLPGAADLEAFWQLLCAGRDGLTRTDGRADGAVPVGGLLADIEAFDYELFRVPLEEARALDPQHRLFVELAAEALDRACVAPDKWPGAIGVYAGAGLNDYPSRREVGRPGADRVAAQAAVDKDHISMRAAHLLGLTGPAVTVQTACSTSLVAVHLACQAIRAGDCEMAIAGGATVAVPHTAGYRATEGGVLSRSGTVRALDAAADGTILGSGGAAVVLCGLSAARAAGLPVLAVVRGSAINNDGGAKLSYAAPSAAGQAGVLAAALRAAGVEPGAVRFVETHGSGTVLGDAIELAALDQVYGRDRPVYLGAVKANVGHADVAAGAAGLLKAALCVHTGTMPGHPHFRTPNPAFRELRGRFAVPTELTPWPADGGPRRAGVSSFGVGGTNAHIILEQSDLTAAERSDPGGCHCLPVSAANAGALRAVAARLADALAAPSAGVTLTAVARTLQDGRRELPARAAVAAHDLAEAVAALRRVAAGETVAPDPLVPDDARAAISAWVAGGKVSWPNRSAGPRAPLPPYPFARPRVWLDDPGAGAPEVGPAAPWTRARMAWAEVAPPLALGPAGAGRVGLWASPPEFGELVTRSVLAPAGLHPSPTGAEALVLALGAGCGADAVEGVLNRLRTALATGSRAAVLLTERCQSVGGHPGDPNAAAGAAWGLAAALAVEHPEVTVLSVDVDPDPLSLAALAAALARPATGPAAVAEFALRGGRWFAPALVPVAQTPGALPLDGTVLITGGLGGIGLELADELVRRGARHLALCGRRPDPRLAPDPSPAERDAADRLRRWAAAGARVSVADLDVADATELQGWRRRLARTGFPPVATVFHLARHVADGTVRSVPAEDLARAVRTSAGGLAALDHVFPAPERTALVAFSSVNALAPQPAQAAYTAPNAATDARVAALAARGAAVWSVRWGLWDGVGYSATADGRRLTRYLRGIGIEPFPAAEAWEVLAEVLASPPGVYVAGRFDWPKLTATSPPARVPPALRALVAPTEPAPAPAADALADLRHLAATFLGRAPEAVATDAPLTAIGFDSLRAVQFQHRVQSRLGRTVPLARLLGGASLEDIARTFGGTAPAAPTPAPAPDAPPAGTGPLTPMQEGLWAAHRFEPTDPGYNEVLAWRIDGPLDAAALAAAIEAAPREYPMLGAAVGTAGGAPRWEFGRAAPSPLRVVRAPGYSDDALRDEIARDARAPFDWDRGPLARWALYQRGEREFVLTLAFAHVLLDDRGAVAVARWLRDGHSHPAADFTTFSVEVANRLSPPVRERLAALWAGQLAGAAHAPTFPPDAPAAPRTGAAHLVTRPVPADVSAAAERLAGEWRVTPAAVGLSRFAGQLGRAAGAADVFVASAVSARTRPDLEHTVGMLVDAVPLRLPAGGDARAAAVAAQGRVADALDHAGLSLAEIARAAGARGGGRLPLCRVMFAWEGDTLRRADGPSARFPGTGWRWWGPVQRTAKFDVTVMVFTGPDGWTVAVQADADRYTAATAERIADEYLRALGELSHDTGESVLDEIARRAVGAPGAVAVEHPGGRVSYADLWAGVERAADQLRARGVSPGGVVAVGGGKSLARLVTTLAVWRCGAAVLPVEGGSAPLRTRATIEEVGARLLAPADGFPADARPAAVPAVTWAELTPETGPGAPFPAVAAADLAYVMFTSGSTGRPKGVMIEHGSLAATVRAVNALVGVGPGDRVAWLTAPTFDIAWIETVAPLCAGATVLIPPEGLTADGPGTARWLVGTGATVAQATPTGWRMLLAGGAPFRLRVAITGGEPLDAGLAGQLLARAGELWNGYAPTETCVYSTFHRVTVGESPVPIGPTLPGEWAEIRSTDDQVLPDGEAGELVIGGCGVARGYWGRPDLDAARFGTDPRRGRFYRTGDRARRRPDGAFEYLGRTDGQLKVRGTRVEPAEVEAVLRDHPAVRDAAVAGRTDRFGDTELVAVVVPAAREPDPHELRAFARTRLPDAMVPTQIALAERLPLTPSNKLDRAAVAELAARPAPRGVGATPGEAFDRVRAAWAEFLGHDRFGPDDAFFDAGGHSLLFARLHAKLSAECPSCPPLAEWYRRPTVRAIAAGLENTAGTDDAAEAAGRRRAARRLALLNTAPNGEGGPL